MSINSVNESAVLVEASEFLESLPQPLQKRLQMNSRCLAADFINAFSSVIIWHDIVLKDESALEHLKSVIRAMISYRDYLAKRVREYNEDSGPQLGLVDEKLFMEMFTGVPFVPDVENKIEELKKISIAGGSDLPDTLRMIEKSCMDAICFIRDDLD